MINYLRWLILSILYAFSLFLNFIYRLFFLLHELLCDLIISLTKKSEWIIWNNYCYKSNKLYSKNSQRNELYAWEAEVIATYFPSPPAHILVLAAGSGREVCRLEELGYKVTASEPVKTFYDNLKTLNIEKVYNYSFKDFIDNYQHNVNDQFQGIIIGWGSISHLATKIERKELLAFCSKICPEGPILVSWIKPPILPSRRKAFRKILLSMGLNGHESDSRFLPKVGAYAAIQDSEMVELAELLKLKIIHRGASDRYPHMILKNL